MLYYDNITFAPKYITFPPNYKFVLDFFFFFISSYIFDPH